MIQADSMAAATERTELDAAQPAPSPAQRAGRRRLPSMDQGRPRPNGEFVEVGGQRWHVNATGSGSPTVVLEAGSSAHSGVWEHVQAELEQQVRVVSYDRAGLGFSEPKSGVRDARTIARELQELLAELGEPGPYVLVGHSYGALFVSAFAELYPSQVAGLVLVDGTHPDQLERNRTLRRSLILFRRMFHWGARLADFGVMRFTDVFSRMAAGLSPAQLELAKTLYASRTHLETSARELDAWSESADLARRARFGDFPKLFLSASGPDTPMVHAFIALHQELAERYPGTEHRILPGTTHISMVTHAAEAKQVTSAILDVVGKVRLKLPT
jgi:pimeloyl-ACP methyl ester carboxylesterase